MAKAPATPDLALLLPSFELTLRAERKSPGTIATYGNGIRAFLTWCEASEVPPVLTKSAVNAYVAHVLDAGLSPATAKARQLAVRRFAAWLTDEGEIDADPLLGIRPPKVDTPVIEPLTEDELRALLTSCQGKEMRDKRDEAIVRFMLETGTRAGEVIALDVRDVDLRNGSAIVRRGKGGKGRVVPFGPQTGQAVDRYLRKRASHRLAHLPDLWVGDRGKGFTYAGLHKALKARAAAAGIERFHPHLLRHTAAHRWLAAGGSEGGLMTVAGWSRPDMLQRYTRARATDRALAESRTLSLGDL